MLLILANNNDSVAEGFSKYLRALGVSCYVSNGFGDATVNIQVQRNGKTAVEIRSKFNSKAALGVLNRGIVGPVDSGNQFRLSEILASWWSALASFSGPVINRPTRFDFIPGLASLRTAGRSEGIARPRCSFSTSPQPSDLDTIVNIHRLRDGIYIGRSGIASLDGSEVYAFTAFDPSAVIHILTAGEDVINLNDPAGEISCELRNKLAPLLAEIYQREARFCLVVLERHGTHLRLLQVNAFPHLDSFRRCEQRVYSGLLHYLTA